MVNIICALCGENQQTEVLYPANFKGKNISSYTYSARRLPDKIHYRFLRCKNCGLIFSSPIFPIVKIDKLYKGSICSYKDQISYVVKTYVGIFNTIKKLVGNDPKVLDVGCGNGFFLEALRKKGISDVFGVEPSSAMVSEAPKYLQKRIKVDIFKPKQFPKNSFNVITCFHTLDHIVKPQELISEVNNILKTGGISIFVVHDTDGLSVKLFGERSPIFDIEHIYLFNKKTLEKLFIKNNFEVIKNFNLVNTYPLSYWLKMSGLPLFVKILMQKVARIFKLSNIKLSLVGGNLCIIARKR